MGLLQVHTWVGKAPSVFACEALLDRSAVDMVVNGAGP